MEQLFKDQNVDFIPLSEFARSYLDIEDSNYGLIQLPPIQRNAVWSSYQIELLWDSIFRGFPIGSFLLSPRKKGSITRNLLSEKQIHSEKEGYFLLDGQQRTRALLLGFKPAQNSRLWIDLDPILTFDNAEFNDRKFLFRHISTQQPWGMCSKNPKEKISENEKYNARYELYKNSVRYDYEVKINLGIDIDGIDNSYSWPVQSKVPVPFDLLVNLCGGFSGKFTHPEWNEVFQLIPLSKRKNANIETPPKHYLFIIESLKKLIIPSECTSTNYISLLKMDEIFNDINEPEQLMDIQDSVEVLFRRINSLGTPLNGEELSFSILKSKWDQSYDLVTSIINDTNVGYLFTPTGFVISASRMARYNMNSKQDIVTPSVRDFRKWIGEGTEEKSFIYWMKELMEINEMRVSKFHSCLSKFCKLVIYDENTDTGLPRKLILSLKPVLIHPVLIWLNQNDIKEEGLARKSVLRYLIYSLFCLNEKCYDKASKEAVNIIKRGSNDFPDKEIYRSWILKENCYSAKMPNSNAFFDLSKPEADGFLFNENELFGIETDEFRGFRRNFWFRKDLLMWFQRKYFSVWFKGYNPMSKDIADTPFDYDHIVPYSHLVKQGTDPNIFDKNYSTESFKAKRWSYIDSIGNLRLWPGWANKSDRDKCPTIKLRLEQDEISIDLTGNELGFQTCQDYISGSLIDSRDLDLWKDAGGKSMEWPLKRRIAWQKAVENRVKYLYEKFYDSYEFSKWNLNIFDNDDNYLK